MPQRGAQLSNDKGRQYLPTDLETIDDIATEDGTVAYVYVDHFKCIWQASEKRKGKKRTETIANTLNKFQTAQTAAAYK